MSLLRSLLPGGSSSDGPSWGEIGAKLAQAVLQLLRAEASSLGADLQFGASVLRNVALWFAVVLCLSLCAGLTLTAAAVVGLSVLVPLWAAALIVGGFLVVLAVVAMFALRRSAGALESPVKTVRRRMANHTEWWQNELASVAHPDGARAAEGTEEAWVDPLATKGAAE